MKIVSQTNKLTLNIEYKFTECKKGIIDIFRERYKGKKMKFMDQLSNNDKCYMKITIDLGEY